MSEPTQVLDLRRDALRASEEHEHLVDGVRGEVVREAVGGQREVLPGALERRAVAVEAALELPERAERVRVGGRETQQRLQREEVRVPAAVLVRVQHAALGLGKRGELLRLGEGGCHGLVDEDCVVARVSFDTVSRRRTGTHRACPLRSRASRSRSASRWACRR